MYQWLTVILFPIVHCILYWNVATIPSCVSDQVVRDYVFLTWLAMASREDQTQLYLKTHKNKVYLVNNIISETKVIITDDIIIPHL